MDLELLKAEYLNYSKHFKSAGTYRYDSSHLKIIIEFLTSSGYNDTDELDFDSIYAFIDYSRILENTNKTINKRISLLNRSIAFEVQQQKCSPSIIAAFPKLKEVDKRFDIVDQQTMTRIIEHLLNQPNTFMSTRNRALVFLFIDTGSRLSEVTNIKTSNINISEQYVLLDHTKTRKERIVYFSDITAEYLFEYMSLVDDSSIYFFRNSINNLPMNYLGIIRVFQKIRDKLGLVKLSSHMIRHSYGTLAYQKKVPSLFTKNTMGHARIEMTERYTHYDIKTNSEIYRSFSPMKHYLDNKK